MKNWISRLSKFRKAPEVLECPFYKKPCRLYRCALYAEVVEDDPKLAGAFIKKGMCSVVATLVSTTKTLQMLQAIRAQGQQRRIGRS